MLCSVPVEKVRFCFLGSHIQGWSGLYLRTGYDYGFINFPARHTVCARLCLGSITQLVATGMVHGRNREEAKLGW
jgi:hypothetical protein